MAQVDRGDGLPGRLRLLDRSRDRAVGAAPADDEEVAGGWTVDRGRRNLLGDAPHFLGARAHHVVVIFRVIRDVPCDVLLLDSAYAVFETRRSRPHPWPRGWPGRGDTGRSLPSPS